MDESLKLADSVLARIVQILQEGMLTGQDVSDLMRLIRLKRDEETGDLVMTEAYEKQVRESHRKLLLEAEKLKEEQLSLKLDTNKNVN